MGDLISKQAAMSDNLHEVYDPAELVKDLADKIGINQLYSIVRDMRGEEPATINPDGLIQERDELKAHVDYLSRKVERLEGKIEGLMFSVRCNGVSGWEDVHG